MPQSEGAASALFDDDGRYIMRNYDDIKPNSNFLAGLGGIWGVPMVRWCWLQVTPILCVSSSIRH